MDRRHFLAALAAAGAAPLALNARPKRRSWVWMRGALPPDADLRRLLARMRAAGITDLLHGSEAGTLAHLAPLTAAEGIALHAWMPTMMRGELLQTHPEWYAVSREGKSTAEAPPYVDYYRFLCPTRPEVRAHLAGVVAELAAVEGLAGIHLDYIRLPDVILPSALQPHYKLVQDREYPPFDYCYCEACRSAFRVQTGRDPLALPDPPADAAWVQFRYDRISEVVDALARVARQHRRQVTAAVFPTPDIARRLVRQDWVRWPLDAVLPMIYQNFYEQDVAWIETATREGVGALGGARPLYAGLYVPELPPADLAEAVRRARRGGAAGIALFNAESMTDDHWRAFRRNR